MATPHPTKRARDEEPSMIKDGATQNLTRVHSESDLCLLSLHFSTCICVSCMRVHMHIHAHEHT